MSDIEKPLNNHLFVQCLECNTTFAMEEIYEDSEVAFCKCENISVGSKKNENSRYAYYRTVTYSRARPKIYEIKGDRRTEL